MAEAGARGNGMRRGNDGLAVFLALFAVLATIPMGSNRATWWLLWTGLLGLVALYQLLHLSRAEARFSPRVRRFRGWMIAASAVPVMALVQCLPIVSYLPGWLYSPTTTDPALQGTTISADPGATLLGAVRFSGYLVLFALVCETATSRRRMIWLGMALFWGIVCQAVWALIALKAMGDYAIWGKDAYPGVATGNFVNRNSLATCLGMGLILGVGLIAQWVQRPRARTSRRPTVVMLLGAPGLLILLGQVAILTSLILTQSRAGLVASALGLGVTLMLWRGRVELPVRRRVLETVLGLAVLAVLIVLAALQTELFDRVLTLERSALARGAIYAQVWDMIWQRPWTGSGLDAFAPAFEGFRRPGLGIDAYVDMAHDSYLALWAELGIVVGSVPILLLGAVGVRCLERRRAVDGLPGLAEAGLGVLVLGACHSLTDFSFEIPANAYLLIVILGMALARVALPRPEIGAGVSPLAEPSADLHSHANAPVLEVSGTSAPRQPAPSARRTDQGGDGRA